MKGIEGQAGDIDGVSVIMQTHAGELPAARDLMGILPYHLKLVVNSVAVIDVKLDSLRFDWLPTALALHYELTTPHKVTEADEVIGYLERPEGQPIFKAGPAGLLIVTAIASHSVAGNPQLTRYFDALGIEHDS